MIRAGQLPLSTSVYVVKTRLLLGECRVSGREFLFAGREVGIGRASECDWTHVDVRG